MHHHQKRKGENGAASGFGRKQQCKREKPTWKKAILHGNRGGRRRPVELNETPAVMIADRNGTRAHATEIVTEIVTEITIKIAPETATVTDVAGRSRRVLLMPRDSLPDEMIRDGRPAEVARREEGLFHEVRKP